MTEPFTAEQLEERRNNPLPRCSGCGCVPQLEHDGLEHWRHRAGCPVADRIRHLTGPEDGA